MAAIAEELAVILESTEDVMDFETREPQTREKIVESENESEISPQKSLISAFLVLFVLLGAMIGASYLFKDSLFFLLERNSEDFGKFAIYAGFVGVSLVAAVVMFGILRSTGIFKKTSKGKLGQYYEFGGAMSGFMVILIFLIGTYLTHTSGPKVLEILGNIRFVTDGNPVGPVSGAKIALSKFSGFETESDRNGNFRLQLPENLQKEEDVELQFTYKEKTYYQKVKPLEMKNVIVEIEKGQTRKFLKITGNVRFSDGKPVNEAKIRLSDYHGFETKTDNTGNFTLNLPEKQKFQKIELVVIYEKNAHFHTVQLSKMENVEIEIEEPGPIKPEYSTEPATEMKFVRIPGGCYEMGCDNAGCESWEKPTHVICVDGFWIGKNKVTQKQWKDIMGKNSSTEKQGDNSSFAKVSWHDTQKFIRLLNEKTGKTFRLPREAEWEYACRNSLIPDICNSSFIEWCEDVFSKNQQNNPRQRAVRWCNYSGGSASCYHRLGKSPDIRVGNLGFRLVTDKM